MHAPVEPHTPSEPDFADIYKTHYRRVFGLCRYLLNSFDAAEDATHEVFLRAQRRLATYDPSLPFPTWLCGIATNHCIDLLRRKTTEKRIFELNAGDAAESAPSAALSPLNELVAAERGQVSAGQAGVVRQEDLPKILRWITPSRGIRGITHNPNRLNLILSDDNTIVQAYWE